MKKTRVIIISAAILVVLCAFVVLPKFHLGNKNGENANISINSADANGSELVILADYEYYGEGFEFASDMEVATDEAFTDLLELQTCTLEDNGLYKYTFECPKVVDQVYVKAPVLFIQAAMEPKEVKIAEGEVMTLGSLTTINSKEADKSYLDTQWFEITSVECDDTDVIKNVTVKFTALENSVLPRLPKLVFDKSAIGGVSSIELDQEGNYTEGEFQFRVVTDADAETILSESYMLVKEVLVQLRASDAGFSSDVVSVNVVKK